MDVAFDSVALNAQELIELELLPWPDGADGLTIVPRRNLMIVARLEEGADPATLRQRAAVDALRSIPINGGALLEPEGQSMVLTEEPQAMMLDPRRLSGTPLRLFIDLQSGSADGVLIGVFHWREPN